jgi:hypothetical protein
LEKPFVVGTYPPRSDRREDIEVELEWSDDPDERKRAPVRLTHKTTGLTAESSHQDSQIANYNTALAELERLLADRDDAATQPGLRRIQRCVQVGVKPGGRNKDEVGRESPLGVHGLSRRTALAASRWRCPMRFVTSFPKRLRLRRASEASLRAQRIAPR